MADKDMESGFELELDNRKLIIAFVVFILLIGGFFVWGYGVGKRQGMRMAATSYPESAQGIASGNNLSTTENTDGAVSEDSAPESKDDQKSLDWYQSTNKKESSSIETQSVRPSDSKQTTEPVISSRKTEASAGSPVSSVATATYTVQVGAFKKLTDAEIHARNVESKGFESSVIPPESAGKLYLVQVGRFGTRAEANAMQSRLKKSGFSCFVKAK